MDNQNPVVPNAVNPTVAQPTANVADDRVALAQPVVQAVAQVPVTPLAPSAPSGKEKIVVPDSLAPFEVVGTDAIEVEPIPPEIESWMEKVAHSAEKTDVGVKVELPSQPTITPVSSQSAAKNVYVIPLGKLELNKGLHAAVTESVRWLATWCTRVIRKYGAAAVAYKEET